MTLMFTFYEEIRTGDAMHVLSQLAAYPNAAVEVRINSPGGSVTEGLAIFNALKPRKPTVYVDGIAASIASHIAMAGQTIIAAQNAMIMIHDPWSQATGNSKDFRRHAELLDRHRDAMVVAYLRTGLSRQKLEALLSAETWMNAEEALSMGFIDQVAEPLRYAAHAPVCFSSYHNTPKDLLFMNSSTNGGVRGADLPAKPNAPAVPTPAGEKILEAFKTGMASEAVAVAAHDGVIAALKTRNEEIVAMAEPYVDSNVGVRRLMVSAMSDPRVTAAEFGQRVLAELARGRGPLNGGGYVSSGSTGSKDFVAAAGDALAMRAGIKIDNPHPGTRDVAGMGLQDILRACAENSGRGIDYGHNRGALVQAAMTTSDFPAILGDSLGKALRAGFAAEPATYDVWTRRVTAPDFKLQERPVLGSAPGLLLVPEGGEYKYGAIDEDQAVPYRVEKFGRIIKLTWEALINDDLGAFLRMTQALGNAAARTEGDVIYATFAENSGAGPTMQDGKALFHVDHANLATSAASLDAAALGAARVLLRRQVAIGGGVLNLTPRYLLVSPEHEQAAETLLAAASRGYSQGSDNALVPAWMAQLELVVEARLNSGAAYLLAGAGSVDTYERAWLESDNGPVIQEKEGFNTDDKSYKVRHVFGGRWLDWRGAVKVPIT